MWTVFNFIFLTNALFIVLDCNTGPWTSTLRFWVGVPSVVSGLGLLLWGIRTLGVKNTSALRDGFVAAGPYLITRNPQYVGAEETWLEEQYAEAYIAYRSKVPRFL